MVKGLGLNFEVEDVGLRVWGLGMRVEDLEPRGWGFGLMNWGSRSEFRVES